MLVTSFNNPLRLVNVNARPQGLACLDKPEQRQQLAIDTKDFLSHGHRIHHLPNGCVEDPITLSDYAESEVLVMIHGGGFYG